MTKFQAPNSKQISTRLPDGQVYNNQIPKWFEACNLSIEHCLEFGIWYLEF